MAGRKIYHILSLWPAVVAAWSGPAQSCPQPIESPLQVRVLDNRPRKGCAAPMSGQAHQRCATLSTLGFPLSAVAVRAVAGAEHPILSWSNRGDLVFDPLCGAGTTCKMAKATWRRWLGVDVSKEYTAVAKRRVAGTIADAIPSLPSRSDPFDEVISAEERSKVKACMMCRWCGVEISHDRLQLTGGRAVTCNKECSSLNSRRRRNELKRVERAAHLKRKQQ